MDYSLCLIVNIESAIDFDIVILDDLFSEKISNRVNKNKCTIIKFRSLFSSEQEELEAVSFSCTLSGITKRTPRDDFYSKNFIIRWKNRTGGIFYVNMEKDLYGKKIISLFDPVTGENIKDSILSNFKNFYQKT